MAKINFFKARIILYLTVWWHLHIKNFQLKPCILNIYTWEEAVNQSEDDTFLFLMESAFRLNGITDCERCLVSPRASMWTGQGQTPVLQERIAAQYFKANDPMRFDYNFSPHWAFHLKCGSFECLFYLINMISDSS